MIKSDNSDGQWRTICQFLEPTKCKMVLVRLVAGRVQHRAQEDPTRGAARVVEPAQTKTLHYLPSL